MIEATTRRVLDNGLTVLLRPARHAPVATFWLWYRSRPVLKFIRRRDEQSELLLIAEAQPE